MDSAGRSDEWLAGGGLVGREIAGRSVVDGSLAGSRTLFRCKHSWAVVDKHRLDCKLGCKLAGSPGDSPIEGCLSS